MGQVVTPGNLGPEFELGTTQASKITVKVDGQGVVRDAVTGELSSPAGSLSYTPGTGILIYDNGQGGTQNIDLSAFLTDIYVNGASFDAGTNIITFTDTDAGTPDVTVDLSALLGVSTDASNSLTNGADGKPFFDASTISGVSTDADQILSVGLDGKPFLDCDTIKNNCTTVCTDAFGVDAFFAFSV